MAVKFTPLRYRSLAISGQQTRSDTVGQTFTFWMSTRNCCKHFCGNYTFFRLSLYALVEPLCNITQRFRIQLCFSKIWWQSNFMQHHSTSFRIQRSTQKPSLCRILNLSFYVDTVGCYWTPICSVVPGWTFDVVATRIRPNWWGLPCSCKRVPGVLLYISSVHWRRANLSHQRCENRSYSGWTRLHTGCSLGFLPQVSCNF